LVIGFFSKGWNANQNVELVNSIKSKIQNLRKAGVEVKFQKVKGHTGKNDGNNAIDRLLNSLLDSGFESASGYFSDYEILGVEAVVKA
jgi:ribonuclease HI